MSLWKSASRVMPSDARRPALALSKGLRASSTTAEASGAPLNLHARKRIWRAGRATTPTMVMRMEARKRLVPEVGARTKQHGTAGRPRPGPTQLPAHAGDAHAHAHLPSRVMVLAIGSSFRISTTCARSKRRVAGAAATPTHLAAAEQGRARSCRRPSIRLAVHLALGHTHLEAAKALQLAVPGEHSRSRLCCPVRRCRRWQDRQHIRSRCVGFGHGAGSVEPAAAGRAAWWSRGRGRAKDKRRAATRVADKPALHASHGCITGASRVHHGIRGSDDSCLSLDGSNIPVPRAQSRQTSGRTQPFPLSRRRSQWLTRKP